MPMLSGASSEAIGRASRVRATTIVPTTPAAPETNSSGASAASAKPVTSSRNGVT